METKLGALQCHFTWDLDLSVSRLLQLGEKLEDIGPEEGSRWLGHLHNLQGYIHHRLGSPDRARELFARSAEAFARVRNDDREGPWLVVNYGNRAWLHHLQGEEEESRGYLARVEALTEGRPEEPHPEVLAEKAWTLMKFGPEQRRLALACFQTAIRMKPGVVEWHSSHALALLAASGRTLEHAVVQKLEIALKHDPENLHLAALHAEASAGSRKQLQEEVRELARRLLKKPASSYSGLKAVLRLCRVYLSLDEAVDLAEEVLDRHPQHRYAKKCAAVCYSKKILLDRQLRPEPSLTSRAVALCREVISLYPRSSLRTRIALADIYGRLGRRGEAERAYAQLLEEEEELEPQQAQMLLCYYAKHAHVVQRSSSRAAEYYMRAAAIPVASVYRDASLRVLERIQARREAPASGDVEKFLAELQL